MKALLAIAACFAAFVLCLSVAHAQEGLSVRKSLVELRPALRLLSYERESGHAQYVYEMDVHGGLDWQGWQYVSIHALAHVGVQAPVDWEFRTRYHNREVTMKALAVIGLEAVVDVHFVSRVVSLEGILRVQAAMGRYRAGIFTVEGAFGIGVMPFYGIRRKGLVRGIHFGVYTWLPIRDDFSHVFDLERTRFNMSADFSLEW